MIKITRSNIRNKVLMLMLAMLALVKVNAWAAITPSTPSKDANGVYQIGTAEELWGFAQGVNDGTIAVSANAKLTSETSIDLGGSANGSFPGIGSSGKVYTGTFDGNGKTITGFYRTITATGQGFFNYTGANAKIKNLTLEGEMTANNPGSIYGVGTLIGISTSTTITDVTSSVKMTLTNVPSGARIFGGLVGRATTSNFNRCRYKGLIDASGSTAFVDRIGGIIGDGSSTIENTLFDGEIKVGATTGIKIAGFAVQHNGAITINNCLFTGKLTFPSTATVDDNSGPFAGTKGSSITVNNKSYYLADGIKKGENAASGYCTKGTPVGTTPWADITSTLNNNAVVGQTANWKIVAGQDYPIPMEYTIEAAGPYTITFDTKGGTAIDPIEAAYGAEITAPADPTKTGYVFAGWDREIPTTMPGANITITAQWTYTPVDGYYLISTKEDFFNFVNVASTNASANAKLLEDINLEEETFNGFTGYKGTFDGNKKTISGYKRTFTSGSSSLGFFNTTDGANIKDFTLEGEEIYNINSACYAIGGLIGMANSTTIEGVTSKVKMTFGANCPTGTGGIRCVGGIAGRISGGSIDKCRYNGTIDLSANSGICDRFGGIVGDLGSASTISNCLFDGEIKVAATSSLAMGGILGARNSQTPTISHCLFNGKLTFPAGANISNCGPISGGTGVTASDSYYDMTGFTVGGVKQAKTAVQQSSSIERTTEEWSNIKIALGETNWILDSEGLPIPGEGEAHVHNYTNGFCLCGGYEPAEPTAEVYQITNAGNLFWFAQQISNGGIAASSKAQLTQNINLNNVEFPGIGEYSADASKAYSGTFDGQGFTISGYNRKVTSGNQQGFFNYAKGATIKNFKLEGTMTDSGASQQHGSVIGWADEGTLIEDVHSTMNVTITSTASQVGGFVGRAGGTFNRCSYSGTVSTNTAYDKIGGFAGSLRAGTIKNCLFDGQLNISTNNESLKAGGFAGAVIEGASSMSNSLVNGTIDISNKTVNCGVTVGLVDKNTTFTMVLYTTANTISLTSAVGSVSSNYTLTGTAKDVTSETWTKVNVMLNPSEGTTGNWKIKTGDGDKAYPVPMLVNDFSHTHTYKNGFCIADDGSYEAAEKDILDGYYKVTNAGNLWWLMQQINSTDEGTLAKNVHIKLINDIDMEGLSHGNFPGICPLGKNASNQDDWDTAFKGIFDGKGHSINNYYRNIASGTRLGLINCANNATIKNFDISGQMIAGAGSTEAALVGVVVGVARGTTAIEDIESHVTITANRVRGLGGIAGCLETSNNQATVTMNRCLYDGTITVSGEGNSGIGGVCGELRSAVIKNSMFDGTISLGDGVGYKYVGGIAGVVQNNSNSEIRRVFMHGRLSLANITTNSVQESGNNKLVTGSQSGLVVGCVKKTLYMEKCFHVKESTGLQDAIGVQFDTESTGTGDDKVTTETIVNYLILGTSTDITTSATILNQKNVKMYDEYFHTTLGKSNWQISSYTSGNYPKPKRDPDHIHQYSNGFCTSGDGEYERPTKMGNAYQIDNGGKLYWFAEQFNAKKINKDVTVEIMNNIDMEGDKYTYPGIGVEGWRFSGTFNGHGNTIRKYRRDIVNAECTGLINYSEKNAVIRNFTINGDVYFNLSVIKSFHGTVLGMGVPSTDKGYEGDLMLIEDVTSNVNVWIQNSYTRVLGGIVGRACGTINRCRYSGNIGKSVDNSSKLVHMESGRQIGGICANAISRIDISNCLFDGKIACKSVADTMRVCGILASNEKSTNVDIKIEKCLFNGCLDLIHDYTGDNKSTENGIIAGYWDTQKASLIDNVYYITDCTTNGLTVGNWKTDPKTNNTTEYKNEPTQDEWVSIKNSLNTGCEPGQENWIIDGNNESIPNANVCKHITDVEHPERYFNEFGWCTICGDRRPIGQEEDGTYKIEYLSDLATFRDKVNSGNSTSTTIYNAKLLNDLDFDGFQGELGQPIGNSFYNRYLYNFDGQGYTIKNIRVTSDQQFVGLFGYAGDTEHDCYIHDFTITGYIDVPYESSKNEEQPLYAGVVGKMFRGKIENVHSQMTIRNSNVTDIVLGGILGSSESEDESNTVIISKCSYIGAATVNAYGSMGGIVGRTSANTLVRDCTFAGSLTSNYEGDIQMTSFGGVVGYNEATTFQGVKNCVIAGAMTTKTTNFKEYGVAGNHKNILCGEDKVITDMLNEGVMPDESSRSAEQNAYLSKYSNNYGLTDYTSLIPGNSGVTPKSMSHQDFASGKVCALLNANDNSPSEVQNGYPWGQILGYQFGTGEHSRTAGSPAQRVPFPGYNNPDKTVYKVTATANAQNSSKKDYVFDYFYFDDADDASPLMPDDAAGMKVKRVQYTRAAATMTSGYISVCLPFALPDDLLPGGSDCEVKVYKDFISDGSTNKVNFRNAADEDRYSNSMYQAGVPYFFYLPEIDRNREWIIDKTYSAGIPMVNSPVNPSDVGIMGSFSKIETGEWSSTSRTYKLNADGNKLLRTTASSHCYPYRGYVKLPATASAKEYQLFFDDEASGIGNVTVETIPDGPRYNVMGQRVTNNAKGVVIVNGRKYLQR